MEIIHVASEAWLSVSNPIHELYRVATNCLFKSPRSFSIRISWLTVLYARCQPNANIFHDLGQWSFSLLV